MDARCCAYSYLKEDSLMCDYEIQTDLMASDTALAAHWVKHIEQATWLHLTELIYHCNGSIRGRMAITQADFEWLMAVYDAAHDAVGTIDYFVVPYGSQGTCWLHHLRVLAKSCVRLAYKIEKEGIEVETLLLDFLNLLSNTYFMLALLENKKEAVQELRFVSKSYAG